LKEKTENAEFNIAARKSKGTEVPLLQTLENSRKLEQGVGSEVAERGQQKNAFQCIEKIGAGKGI